MRAFEGPVSVREALARVQDGRILVPAIQRRFVWHDNQIVALFDSLLRGYPIGTC